VIRIAISQAAFEAIARTLPLGSVSFENASNAKGERTVWLEPVVVDRLAALRGPGRGKKDVPAGTSFRTWTGLAHPFEIGKCKRYKEIN
jgi:hypothetical protein